MDGLAYYFESSDEQKGNLCQMRNTIDFHSTGFRNFIAKIDWPGSSSNSDFSGCVYPFTSRNPCPAEPGYALPLQTV